VSTRPSASTTTTMQSAEPGWTPVSYNGHLIAVDERTFEYPDGAAVTVARFHFGQTRFELHVGTTDPPTGSVPVPEDARPALSSAELPVLLAAFNGGFKASADAGGFELEGNVLRPLVDGDASFVIDADGSGHVGVWGTDLPAPGEKVASVRQNLGPLVTGSEPSAQASDVALWGATLGGGAMVARSALGEDPEGNILYAGSISTVPLDLADALVASGASRAMEMDINPGFVALVLAPSPGGPLRTGVPSQHPPANAYVEGWSRDFVAVLAS
jgi:hypothetical protein